KPTFRRPIRPTTSSTKTVCRPRGDRYFAGFFLGAGLAGAGSGLFSGAGDASGLGPSGLGAAGAAACGFFLSLPVAGGGAAGAEALYMAITLSVISRSWR